MNVIINREEIKANSSMASSVNQLSVSSVILPFYNRNFLFVTMLIYKLFNNLSKIFNLRVFAP